MELISLKSENSGIKIEKKSFVSSIAILFILMLAAGLLTRLLPQGSFDRITAAGREVIVPNSFKYIEKAPYPIYRWFTAPFEVLWSSDALMIIIIILFILIIGGTFYLLDKSGLLKYFMFLIVKKYANNKYLLLSILSLFFMTFGSVLGIFEELIALVPISIVLAYSLGWDSLIGVGMSALSAGFGFAAATFNPFTIGIAQKLAGLPLFSGVTFRIIIFLAIYFILIFFLVSYAKKIENKPELSLVFMEDKAIKSKYTASLDISTLNELKYRKALKLFFIFLFLIFIFILSSFFIKSLSDISLPIIGVLFTFGGILSTISSGYNKKDIFKDFISGLLGIAPGIILILMAMSIKLIITKGNIIDTILYYSSNTISDSSPMVSALLIYYLVFIMDFFIGSGSAKAFLVIPIIAPLADLVGTTRQTAVQAFCFGDGFSNMLFPTNPTLLITLGLTVISYGKWFKWTIKLQLAVVLITSLFIILAVKLNYGPF